MSLTTISTSYVKLHVAIRAACLAEGWEIFSTYNDKAKNDRRLSYCRNGWPVPKEMKAKILNKVNKILGAEPFDAKAEWHVAERGGYGSYDKLTIRVPH